MQARIRILAFWKDRFSARARTDGDKGKFPSESESNDTCSDQSDDSRDDTRSLLGSNSSNSAGHRPSQCNTGKSADLLRVFTQVRCHGSGLQI
jgi:hypothetical protein